MEQVMWVEVLSRHHEVIARHRCVGPAIFIGRGYGNDIVVDDPYIAPRHLRIEHGADGVWTAVDLGSKSGLALGENGRRQERVRLDGNRPIRIGQTLLRIRTPDFAVAAEGAMPDGRNQWLATAGLLTLFCAYSLLGSWLEDSKTFKFTHYAGALFSLAFFLLGWTGLWAVLTRIFAGAAKFQRHLAVAIGLGFAGSLFALASSYAAFEFSAPLIDKYAFIIMWIVIGFFCFLHLRVMGPSRLAFKAGLAAALAFAAIGASSMFMFGEDSNQNPYDYIGEWKPALVRLVPPQPDHAYWADVAALKTRLDEARKTPPSAN